MIDNYDSFTYNLVQYLGELGVTSRVLRNDVVTVEEVEARIEEEGLEAIIISPGPCTPKEAGISVPLVRALSGRVPILGVCLGHQAIGAAFGAEIVRAERIMHGKTSRIFHEEEGIFRGIENPFVATRYHSLVVAPPSVPSELIVDAWTFDGDGEAVSKSPDGMGKNGGRVIMGMHHRTHPTYGVQFHPESILTTVGHAVLKNFLDIVASFSV
ncbi:MAG: aminodeoxychorismate/anthranilate synthase component II [Candidatus Hydrogenedentota bacterium]|nr:MAG: aminodeoxychorismate/anthranilate synthase component II [Candidatus Hydrogenedentota bacterium]